jgi:hypothetical protein
MAKFWADEPVGDPDPWARAEPDPALAPEVPPGWYADPQDAHLLRWWTGAAWTQDTTARTAPARPAPASTTPTWWPRMASVLERRRRVALLMAAVIVIGGVGGLFAAQSSRSSPKARSLSTATTLTPLEQELKNLPGSSGSSSPAPAQAPTDGAPASTLPSETVSPDGASVSGPVQAQVVSCSAHGGFFNGLNAELTATNTTGRPVNAGFDIGFYVDGSQVLTGGTAQSLPPGAAVRIEVDEVKINIPIQTLTCRILGIT